MPGRISLLLALLVVGGCASGPEDRLAGHHQCPPQRPQMCTMEYAPVCALLENGRRKEYASGCNACSDKQVIGYDDDACP